MDLRVSFLTDSGHSHTHYIKDIRRDVAVSEINDYCNSLIGLAVIAPDHGNNIVSVDSKQTIETIITDLI